MNKYYHNPNCTKSGLGFDFLKNTQLEYKVIEYLKEPLSTQELEEIFDKLKQTPAEVIRKKEDIYNELELGTKEFSSEELIQTIIKHPNLLERPIFVTENSAVIGRPFDKLKEFLADNFGVK